MTIIPKGYRTYSSNDDSYISCSTSTYCPGIDGGSYSEYSGLTVSTSSFTARPPGSGCSNNEYSNGGITCSTCSPGNSDRSQCRNAFNAYIDTQFAESYYNEKYEREGVTITCLDSSDIRGAYPGSITGTPSYDSGAYGETCNIEASGSGRYAPGSCDGIRDTDNSSKLGGLKNKHSLSHYQKCSWCPDNLNCEYHNSFFTFFAGFLLECPFGEYSPNGNLECHRKDADTFCKTGFYRAILTTQKDDQWINDQDKTYECIPVNQSPTSGYTAVDTTKSPDCGAGDWVRYGIEGCQANAPGFYNGENIYTDSGTKCTDGFYCRSERIKDQLKTAQFACPKGSVGMTAGAYSEFEQCDFCREGKYCPEGTSLSNMQTCTQGYFCPAGTSGKLQLTCGPGFYGAGTGGKHFSDTCTMCPAASYCTPSSTAGQTCPNGYYCFKYTDDQHKHPVLPGKYIGSATGVLSGSTACPQGKYCPLGSTAPVDCPTGTFTASTGMGELMNCGSCPAVSACPTAGK